MQTQMRLARKAVRAPGSPRNSNLSYLEYSLGIECGGMFAQSSYHLSVRSLLTLIRSLLIEQSSYHLSAVSALKWSLLTLVRSPLTLIRSLLTLIRSLLIEQSSYQLSTVSALSFKRLTSDLEKNPCVLPSRTVVSFSGLV
jgi:hypothetical protein